MVISMLMTTNLEACIKMALQRILYIWYLVQFQQSQANKVWALINFDSEVNAMTRTYTAKLGLTTRKTNVDAQKIDDSPLETYGMALTWFSL